MELLLTRKFSWHNFRVLASFIGIVTTIICVVKSVPNYPELYIYWMIPLAYTLFHVLGWRIYKYETGIALIVLEVVMFARFILAPLVTTLFQTQDGLFIYNGCRENLNLAVFLMLYELLAVFFMINCFIPRVMQIKLSQVLRVENVQEVSNSYNTSFVGWGIIAFWFYIIVKSPACRSYMFRITDIAVQTISQQEYQSNIPGAFLVFYYIGLVILYAMIINLVQRQRGIFKSKAIRWLAIISSSFMFVSSTWSNGESVSRWALIVGLLIMLYILIQNFPDSKKKIIYTGIVLFVGILLIGSFAKRFVQGRGLTFWESIESYISVKYVNEYFSGVFPIANGIATAKQMNGNSFVIWLQDCFANIPYFLSNFNLKETSSLIQFRALTSRFDLIMPTIASGYRVFTIVGAPIYSMILIALAYLAENKLRKTADALIQVFLLYIVFWCSLFMAVNVNIVQSACWKYVIGLVLIAAERKLLRKKR